MGAYLVKRQTKSGTRWHVRVELPGRPIIHLGSFETEKLAKIRRQAALESLARGETPTRGQVQTAPPTTIAAAGEAWLASRRDLATGSITNYARTLRAIPGWLASMQPEELDWRGAQRYVEAMSAAGRARGTMERELVVLRGILDYAGVSPNPTRDPRIRLPRKRRKPHRLPTREQILALHEALPQYRDLMILLEHTGLRIHEAGALCWADIDTKRDRLLVQDSKTTAGRRFVDRLPGTPEFPKREGQPEDARVFGPPRPRDLTTRLGQLHTRRGMPRFGAHDLRHLHASRLLHQQILSPAQIAARLGHADPGVTLRIYSHVVPPDD